MKLEHRMSIPVLDGYFFLMGVLRVFSECFEERNIIHSKLGHECMCGVY